MGSIPHAVQPRQENLQILLRMTLVLLRILDCCILEHSKTYKT